jgi:hypothetical protein
VLAPLGVTNDRISGTENLIQSEKHGQESIVSGALVEAGKWNFENRNWKMEDGKCTPAGRAGIFHFRVSIFHFPVSGPWAFSYSKIQIR